MTIVHVIIHNLHLDTTRTYDVSEREANRIITFLSEQPEVHHRVEVRSL